MHPSCPPRGPQEYQKVAQNGQKLQNLSKYKKNWFFIYFNQNHAWIVKSWVVNGVLAKKQPFDIQGSNSGPKKCYKNQWKCKKKPKPPVLLSMKKNCFSFSQNFFQYSASVQSQKSQTAKKFTPCCLNSPKTGINVFCFYYLTCQYSFLYYFFTLACIMNHIQW